ncbi:hypothetical protein E4U09_006425 [Claviceps aff. purpurea]|uniref:Protoplast regeneration and killer toxin resistance protein n=1 Tax=Claviceps aff. purpurea TaxID=1967640 RepID=A0A9P7TZE9_9HYPO|nr:hypothetical protein E4U09_006425 [Claviceps aff. purpurea]
MTSRGGYGGGGGAPQRPYAGPAAQRPTARGGYAEEYAQQPYGARQPYNDGYAHEPQSGAYDDNSSHYRDQYGPGPGTGGGPMPPHARRGGGEGVGGLTLREAWVQRLAGECHHENLLRGPEAEADRNNILLLTIVILGTPSGRRPLPTQNEAAYGGGYDQDQQLAGQMSGLELNAQRPRGPDERGRPDNGGGRGQRAGYGELQQDARAGPASPSSYSGYDAGYAGPQSPTYNGAPGNGTTMPTNNPGAYHMPAPRRVGTMPFSGAGDMGGVPPPRPATAGSHRPPPRRVYPSSKQEVSQGQYSGGDHYERGYTSPSGPPGPGAGYGTDHGTGPAHAPLSEEPFDPYYGGPQVSGGSDHQSSVYDGHPGQPAYSDYDSTPAPVDNGRPSYEQSYRGPPGQPQPGAHGTPRLHHARSEADFHEPQAAVFEMVGDIPSVPPVPPVPQMRSYQPEFNQEYAEAPPTGYQQPPPRGPSAPPGAVHHDARRGFDPTSGMSRHAPAHAAPVGTTNPDALPSHPTPVRPGLMPNSIVNMNDRPPPVRNYNAVTQQPQYGQARPPPPSSQQQQQQHYPPQPAPGRTAYPPPVEPEQLDEPVTPQQLERLRMAIKMNANDQDSALKLAKKLILAADHLAPRLPEPKQRTKARDRYLADAHKVLKKLASAQNQEAMYTLADSLGRGLFSHDPDTKEAFTLYQSAAKLGHAQAAYRTAVCCEIGHEDGGGTRKDPLKAMQWYKRAATLGDTPAMYKIGMILLKGLLGQPRNPHEAVAWLQRAAERADRENPHALHELGLLYESAQPNDAIPRDERYAFELFHQAAALGYKYAEFRLGLAYEVGQLGVLKDNRQSIYWYSQAAQQEEHQSELALSGCVGVGQGGVCDGVFHGDGHWGGAEFGGCEEVVLEGCW